MYPRSVSWTVWGFLPSSAGHSQWAILMVAQGVLQRGDFNASLQGSFQEARSHLTSLQPAMSVPGQAAAVGRMGGAWPLESSTAQ